MDRLGDVAGQSELAHFKVDVPEPTLSSQNIMEDCQQEWGHLYGLIFENTFLSSL